MSYDLQLDPDADREAVDRAMRFHPDKCPVYRSLHPQIEISVALSTVEEG